MKSYEQKYKAALEWMQSLYRGLHGATKEDAEHYFPELKENKSERVRKGLIKTVSSLLDNTILYHTDITKEEALAWLEKQGEKKPAENVKALDADKVIAWMKNTIKQRAENYVVYKETHLILPYNSIEDLINDFKEDFGL